VWSFSKTDLLRGLHIGHDRIMKLYIVASEDYIAATEGEEGTYEYRSAEG